MDIVIPTYGRSHDQQTLSQLLTAGLHVTLVVQEREKGLYAEHMRAGAVLRVLPPEIQTIAPTRQWIVENVGHSDQLCMVDDDLVFYKRRDDDRTKLRDITSDELREAFGVMESHLHSNGHVGFAAREGANRNTDDFSFNTRIMRVLGYRRDILLHEMITFGRLPVMEDFDVALRLLRAGYPNLILNNYAHNQGGSGSRGGCSHFRTPELHAAAAEKLAALHPGFVAVVDKTTSGAWGGGTRKDVHIQWKKAWKARTKNG